MITKRWRARAIQAPAWFEGVGCNGENHGPRAPANGYDRMQRPAIPHAPPVMCAARAFPERCLKEEFMGLSTHVLDTMHGTPAAGMEVTLYEVKAGGAREVKRFRLDRDGRNPGGLLYDDQSLRAGSYRLSFGVADYFRARGVPLPEPPFLGVVSIDFGVADASQHYHVPLLVSPWSYSTYRGS